MLKSWTATLMVRPHKILQIVSCTKLINTNKLFLAKFCAFEQTNKLLKNYNISLPCMTLSVLLTGLIIIKQRASSKYESS